VAVLLGATVDMHPSRIEDRVTPFALSTYLTSLDTAVADRSNGIALLLRP